MERVFLNDISKPFFSRMMLILASLLVGTQCMWFDVHDRFDKMEGVSGGFASCNVVLEFINPSYFWPSKYGLKKRSNTLEKWNNRTDKKKGHLCSFTFDKNLNCEMGHNNYWDYCKLVNVTTINWQCSVPQSFLCNGVSECLTDECGCKGDAFRCVDGLGCIAMKNLCDGDKDCKDGSDECMCDNVVTCHNGLEKFCVPKDKYHSSGDLYLNCAGTEELNLNETGTLSTLNQLENCIDYLFDTMDPVTMMTTLVLTEDLITWCHSNCNSSCQHYCENLVLMTEPLPVVRFSCEKKKNI